MKIDILVTGQFPRNLYRQDLEESLYRLHKVFTSTPDHQFNFRYHTWDTPEMRSFLAEEKARYRKAHDIMETVRDKVIYSKPPSEIYNPFMPRDWPHGDAANHFDQFVKGSQGFKFQTSKYSDKGDKHPVWTRTFQIMSTKELIESIPKSEIPDLYIRVRWDVLVSYNFNFISIINKAFYNNLVVGFSIRPHYMIGNHTHLENGDPKRRVWSFHNETRYMLETGTISIEEADDQDSHYKMIADSMIMFHPKRLNTTVVDHWFKNKFLLPAEWGWWQTLCFTNSVHNKHVNVNGGVTFWRHAQGGNYAY